jgi:spermidine/putrescine transport system ATP-binding protein
MSEHLIVIEGVSKAYTDHTILDEVHLTVRSGEFLTLLGPSGCGKTTLLRLIAGLEIPDQGRIYLNGQDVTNWPPNRRHVNTVFQHHALFPHMTVFENIAFGLRCQHLPQNEIEKRVQNILKIVKLEMFAARKPHQLSGGQQQRVAIARAVVNEPLVLLLDEPLSSLDYRLRKNMQMELKQLQRQLGITFIFVTHDQEEALSMSDRIAIIQHGSLEQVGTPREIYEEPRNLNVAQFIGEVNIFDTEILKSEPTSLTVKIEGRILHLNNRKGITQDQSVYTLIRPEDIKVWDETEVTDTENMLPAIVEEVIYKGCTVDLLIRLPSNKLIMATQFFDEDDDKLDYTQNEKVWVEWYPGWEVLLPHE